MLKIIRFSRALFLFLVTASDIMTTGIFTLAVALFSPNKGKIIYDWVRGWGGRGLKRYGITIKIIGEENWLAAKQIILLANHQSMVEALILSRFLRDDMFFVGKKKLV